MTILLYTFATIICLIVRFVFIKWQVIKNGYFTILTGPCMALENLSCVDHGIFMKFKILYLTKKTDDSTCNVCTKQSWDTNHGVNQHEEFNNDSRYFYGTLNCPLYVRIICSCLFWPISLMYAGVIIPIYFVITASRKFVHSFVENLEKYMRKTQKS